MAGSVDADRVTPLFPRAATRIAAALGAVILVAIGFVLGRGGPAVDWHEGSAFVGSDQAAIEVEGDDWTYGFSDGVAWIDEAGSHHDSGWPECMAVPAGTGVESVRFATVDVEVAGMGRREVVLVDCQQR